MESLASVGNPDERKTFAGYSKYYWTATIPRDRWNELAWVNRWYNPDDERSFAPVQRHKFLGQPQPMLRSHSHWIQPLDPPANAFSRSKEEKEIHFWTPKSRCEQWSTLREILPSRGHTWSSRPPKWGTNHSSPPTLSARHPRRHPHINSTMTNYIDDMHKTNRLFRLF